MTHKQQIKALLETIKWFKKEIGPHDCGWMYTTIDGLKHRIKHLRSEIRKKTPRTSWIEGYNKWKELSKKGVVSNKVKLGDLKKIIR